MRRVRKRPGIIALVAVLMVMSDAWSCCFATDMVTATSPGGRDTSVKPLLGEEFPTMKKKLSGF